jgi:hypothetical protein
LQGLQQAPTRRADERREIRRSESDVAGAAATVAPVAGG